MNYYVLNVAFMTEDLYQNFFQTFYDQGPLLLTWFNFNPIVDK